MNAAIAANEASIFAIKTHLLMKSFGKQIAVDKVSISIPPGQIFGLLGPNGAGKSTLIKLLMGLIAPDSGEVNVLGNDVAADRDSCQRKCRIGYVPEIHQIYRWMRVDEVVRFCKPFYQHWDDSLANQLLDTFELPISKKVKQLSKGMTAKLGLLLALSHHPELLILDEPTSGLDPLMREEFLDGILSSLRHGEHTVLFSSHQVDDVRRLSDTIGIMDQGQLLLTASVEVLSEKAKRVHAVLHDGCLPTVPVKNMVRQHLNRREWIVTIYPACDIEVNELSKDPAVQSLEICSVGLEDLFKDLVKGRRDAA